MEDQYRRVGITLVVWGARMKGNKEEIESIARRLEWVENEIRGLKTHKHYYDLHRKGISTQELTSTPWFYVNFKKAESAESP